MKSEETKSIEPVRPAHRCEVSGHCWHPTGPLEWDEHVIDVLVPVGCCLCDTRGMSRYEQAGMWSCWRCTEIKERA